MTRRRVTDRRSGEHVADVGLDDLPTDDPAVGRAPLVLESEGPPSRRGRQAVEVVVDGWQFELEVEDAERADLRDRASGGRSAAASDGPTEVRAMIPGRVVAVAVAVGDEVSAGQRLLAVEAMKMENELRAPRAGTIERVAVAVGQTVELGMTLVVIR